MGRAGQQVVRDEDGPQDRISVGLLARAFPRARVEAVIEASGAREQRVRMLPSWLVVYYVLALALFMDMGGGRVMRKLAGTLAWAARGVIVVIPSEEALSRARARLGPVPLRLLFEQVAGPLATAATPGGFWRGRRVLSVDGTTLDVQDTPANWTRFGGPGTASESGRALAGGFPKMRVVALAECGTRALIAAKLGSYATSEKALTIDLLPMLGKGMLVLADRNFPGHDLWAQATATGADLLWRAGSAFPLPVQTVLPDGTYLSVLAVPKSNKDKRRAGAGPITVRVVEYHLLEADGSPTEVFALLTTLLDPETAPAAELAELYHARWQIENAFSALKSQLKGDGVVLRSKTPDGAEQELWALLCAYHAIRELICAAAELTDRDPLRLSFIAALDAVRGPVGDPAAFPP
jgi:Insertion element 4 transposase N-terminal/Transposase DDE domain